MEPEQAVYVECEPLSTTTLLALYTTVQRNSVQQRVPHTRSVMLAREADGALLVLQGLEFVLYVASDGELTHAELLHCMQESYCFKHCSRKARDALTQQRADLLAAMQATRVFAEQEWARAPNDAARRALAERALQALPVEQRSGALADPVALCASLLAHWHHCRALEDAAPERDAQAELFADYRRLTDPVLDRAALDADAFFVVRALRRLEVSVHWPCAARLRGKQVWEARFDSHAALEHFAHSFRAYPLELGGQWYPERLADLRGRRRPGHREHLLEARRRDGRRAGRARLRAHLLGVRRVQVADAAPHRRELLVGRAVHRAALVRAGRHAGHQRLAEAARLGHAIRRAGGGRGVLDAHRLDRLVVHARALAVTVRVRVLLFVALLLLRGLPAVRLEPGQVDDVALRRLVHRRY